MLFYLGLILMSLVISLDGFWMGITYGVRNITISFKLLFIVMFCNFLVFTLSMFLSNWVGSFLKISYTNKIGGLTLILLGLGCLYNVLKIETKSLKKDVSFLSFQKKEKIITSKESFFLGFILAIDSFGAGFGASMLGYPLYLTAFLTSLIGGIFILLGMQLGLLIFKLKIIKNIWYFPSFLLIVFGLIKMF
ncbi:MAG: manganese efflux pump [Bacilli bacterium]|jgi:putative Mn2+ efflux pump MntP